MKLTVHVDGGARGNPGPAAIAAVVSDEDGEIVHEANETIGRATNNVAEYRALLLGIDRGLMLGATELDLVGDSELIVKQVQGKYKVKDAGLKPLHAEARAKLGRRRLLVDPPRPPRAQRRGRPPRQRGARRGLSRPLAVHPPSIRATGPPSSLDCRLRAAVAQLARASACHAEGRGFESHQPLSGNPALKAGER